MSEVDDYIQEFDYYAWKTNDTHATRIMCERRKKHRAGVSNRAQ
jgi:hypothetical protein